MNDKEFLTWIHERLQYIHKESPNQDYMVRLRQIIDGIPLQRQDTLEMEGVEPTRKAKRAILHTLTAIRNNPAVGYYLGELTETFSLLTEAAATLYGEPVAKVREFYHPKNPRKPGSEELRASRARRKERTVKAMVLPPVLDPCCGPRMWWFDHSDARALFGDRRREKLTIKDTSHGRADGWRVLRIDPDIDLDFRAMPFPDDTFHLVAFDPPHLVRAGAQSWMAAKYGKLGPDWREDLRAGFAECFRVLRTHGVLVFKWAETQVKVREVLALTPEAPLFGNTSGRKSGTHWIVFMKQNMNMRLEERSAAE